MHIWVQKSASIQLQNGLLPGCSFSALSFGEVLNASGAVLQRAGLLRRCRTALLYTSHAADELTSMHVVGRSISDYHNQLIV